MSQSGGDLSPNTGNGLLCQSLNADESRCGRPATHIVRGRPGYLWMGYHCDEHTERARTMFDHQGGCVVVPLDHPGRSAEGSPRAESGNTPSGEPPEGCHWIGPWRQLDDPIWKWTRHYESEKGVIGCIERRESSETER